MQHRMLLVMGIIALMTTACSQKRQAAPGTTANKPASDGEVAAKKGNAEVKKTDRPSASQIAARLRLLHEAASDSSADIVGVTVDKEVFRVTLAGGEPPRRVDTAIVSRSGDFLMKNAVDLRQELHRMATDKRFATCLRKAGIQLFVQRGDARSRAMMRRIGRFADLIAVDCSGRGKEQCQKMAVGGTPAISLGGSIRPDANSIEWLESATGCKLAR
ncbi:MAG: hypothetical protein KC502_09065 [Myxococcales bacterium]|nr:hypothetical protein [Myxococcales bacterium]